MALFEHILPFCFLKGDNMPKLESEFQTKLRKEIEKIFPGAIVLKNDSAYLQGIPDLSVFYQGRWAWLEVKRSWEDRCDPEPNQEYYVEYAALNSFGAFIWPENKNEVLGALREFFN